MIEITGIEYKESHPGDRPGGSPYRRLLFSVRLPDGSRARFLVDEQSVRMLDDRASKGAISRKNVTKIVVRQNSKTAFSVIVYVRQGVARGARSPLPAILQAASPAYAEEIGTSFDQFDSAQVVEWLRTLGYAVEYSAAPTLDAKEAVDQCIRGIIEESLGGADRMLEPALARGVSHDDIIADAIVNQALQKVSVAESAGVNRSSLRDAILHALELYGHQDDRLEAEAKRRGVSVAMLLTDFVAEQFWSIVDA